MGWISWIRPKFLGLAGVMRRTVVVGVGKLGIGSHSSEGEGRARASASAGDRAGPLGFLRAVRGDRGSRSPFAAARRSTPAPDRGVGSKPGRMGRGWRAACPRPLPGAASGRGLAPGLLHLDGGARLFQLLLQL